MSKNLSISFHHPDAISNIAQWARIDNNPNPTFSTVAGIVSSPAVIATNIPAGQYQVKVTPVYADGRVCDPTIQTSAPCPPLLSIGATLNNGVLIVNYLAPSSVPKVRITVSYPNGGSSIQNYVNDGNPIAIPIPDVDGDYNIQGQSVCDESSGWYSSLSSTVTVNKVSSNVIITSDGVGITVNTLSGIAGFILPANVVVGSYITGLHTAFYNAITFTFTGTPTLQLNATIDINGTIVQCVNIPNTNGGTVTFPAVSVAASDLLRIDFNTGSCP